MRIKHKVIAISTLFGLLVWVIDSVIDYFVFYEGTMLELLITDVPIHEIYMRLVIIACFILFGSFVSRIMVKREAAEEEIRLQSEIMKNMVEGVYLIGLEDVIIRYANPKFETMFGYRPGEMIGKHASIVNAPTDKDPKETAKEIMNVIYKTGEWHGEVHNIKKDGTTFWCYANVSVFDHPKFGKVIIAIHTDISERKLAERQVQEQKLFLETIINSLQHPFYVIDAEDYTIKLSNTATGKLKSSGATTCYSLTHGTGKPCDEAEHPCPLKITKRTGKPAVTEHIHLDNDGNPFYAEVHSYPIFDDHGQVTQIIEYSINISERKKIEENLKKALRLQTIVYQISDETRSVKDLNDLYKTLYEHLGTVIDTTNFYIALYDQEVNLMSFPFFVDEVDTYPEPGPPGRGLTEYVLRTGSSLFITNEDIHKMAKAGEIDLLGTPSELWLGTPLIAGETTIGVLSVQSYTDPNKYTENDLDILKYVSGQIADEITYMQAKDSLKASEERFRNISTLAHDAILMMDPHEKISYWNKAAERIFGHPEKDVIGKDLHQLIVPSRYHDQYKQGFREFQKNGQGAAIGETVELVAVNQSGAEFPVAFSLSAVQIDGEWNAIGIVRDVTDVKRAENALRDANSLKETLLDIITHDLKNPIGVISNMTEMMQEEHSDNEMLEIIKNSSDQLLQVMDNATVLSQIALGDEIKKAEMNIAEILQSVAKEFSPQLERSGMTLKVKLSGEILVMANPIISEVFKNYISNAIKYATEGKKIIIDSDVSNEFLTVNVQDAGTVIPEKNRSKIFERSFQVDSQKPGRGLGLSIVKRIGDAHNAEVGVKPNKPTGNIFYIKIPLE